MDRFIKMRLHDSLRDEDVERWFNIDMIRHFEPDTNRVMMNGAKVPMVVSTDSMERLLEAVKNDVAQNKSSIIMSAQVGRIERNLCHGGGGLFRRIIGLFKCK